MSIVRKRAGLLSVFGFVTVATAVALAMAFNPSPAKGAVNTEGLPGVQALSDTFAGVSEKASPAVVFIEVEKELKGSPASFRGGMGPGLFRHFFFGPGMGPGMGPQGGMEPMIPNQGPVPMGQGSGFIISSDGYIVTNNHVVGEADVVKVSLSDGRKFEAKIVGTDPQTEIALIKIDADGLPTLPLGDSEKVRVGEWVLAIGSPFGLSHSVTSGIVSARGRGNVGIVDYADFIQTDAAINPGNSGGPLINMNGEVIGMNTAIVSRAGGSDGVGFAIPVNMIKYIVDQLRDHGSISRGFLGISIQGLTPELAKWFGTDEQHGVLVADVAKDSPAEKAGLQRDDVILELNGKPVEELGAFRSHIATTPAGKDVELTLLRDGERINKTVEIGTLPGEQMAMNTKPGEKSRTELGLAVEGLTDELAQRLGYEGESGVVVSQVEPGSTAAMAGVKPGALIKEVNKKPVNNPREFQEALKHGDKNNTALLLMKEGEGSRYVALETA